MLAEELLVLNAASPLWNAARPLLDVALRLEQYDESYTWCGWNKQQISSFLKSLPKKCSLVVGVCEVWSIRAIEALAEAGLKAVEHLEPGVDDALEIMRVVRTQVAPVAYALFTDKAAWDEWLFAADGEGSIVNKGDILASLAQQGRCVVLGSQTAHHHLS